jgi:uncharacterized protein (DUF2147 family)
MKRILFLKILGLLFCLNSLFSQSPIGVWKTIDDETGREKSYVEIYESDGKMFGKIVQLLEKSPETVCEKCPGSRKNQKLVGMIILENMEKKDGMWKGGKILDPNKGKFYTCEMWLKSGDPNKLELRGYISFLYRTQTWFRVK